MKSSRNFITLALAALIPLACSTTDPARIDTVGGAYPERIDELGRPIAMGPETRQQRPGHAPAGGGIDYARNLGTVNASELPQVRRPAFVSELTGPANKRSHAPGPFPESSAAELRARAKGLRGNPNARQTNQADIGDIAAGAPTSATGFAGPDAGDCCGGTSVGVPPDAEMAAGPDHVVVAVNSAYAVYRKSDGALVAGPTTFEDFFADADACGSTFDPNVLYDESNGRFFMGIVGNGNGTDYCYAFSDGSDATGSWTLFSTQVDFAGNFFDYPHAGVGDEAIYVGANMFGASFEESYIMAIGKPGTAQSGIVASQSIGFDFTPQPMNQHGANFSTTHYFIANDLQNDGTWGPDDFIVWTWSNPFLQNAVQTDNFSLPNASPIAADFPVSQPQQGSRRAAVLDGGDWRIQDAESDGSSIVMTQAVSCNPGGGTVNCVRWAELSTNNGSIVVDNVDMIFSSGEYRSYPDAAINSCGQIAVGYSKTASDQFTSVWAAGRDTNSGVLGAEVELKAGEATYTSFQSWRQPNRWGDYTGMTVDPDGSTFWYVGEYAGDIGLSTNWATHVASFQMGGGCGGGPGPEDTPVVASDDSFDWDLADGPDLSGDVTGNDTTGESSYTVAVLQGPASGNLNLNPNGMFDFTPAGTGQTSFTYTLSDGDNDNDASNDSDTANVIINVTDTSGPGNDEEIYVSDLQGSSSSGRGNKWSAEVVISVTDDSGPVSGATVEGDWSGAARGGASCTTNDSGKCSVSKSNLKGNSSVATYTVNNLSATGFIYNSSLNVTSSIDVNKP